MTGLNLWFSETGFIVGAIREIVGAISESPLLGMKHRLLQKPGFSCGHASPLQICFFL